MHPELQKISRELAKVSNDKFLHFQFALQCIEDVAGNLEDDEAMAALEKFRACMHCPAQGWEGVLAELAADLNNLASRHPGSKSIDGTRHAAVSATYALAKAVNGRALDAAAYAAYSALYGYGGYAVSDPESYTEIHLRQMGYLHTLLMANHATC